MAKHTQTIIDATQKETAIDQQQHSCEMLICQHHQTILRFLPTAATASTRWRVRELYYQTSHAGGMTVPVSFTLQCAIANMCLLGCFQPGYLHWYSLDAALGIPL
jgi:hypothetical protein